MDGPSGIMGGTGISMFSRINLYGVRFTATRARNKSIPTTNFHGLPATL